MTYNVFSGTLNPTHFTSPEIVAASQRTARAQGRERIYLMSLATQVVVRCSILCSKFTKNGLSGPTEGAYSAPSDPLTELRSHFVAEKEREEKKEGERGKGREGWSPEQKSWVRPCFQPHQTSACALSGKMRKHKNSILLLFKFCTVALPDFSLIYSVFLQIMLMLLYDCRRCI